MLLLQGTDQWVSMGVASDGSYGTPKDVMFSFPCTCEKGKWSIVQVRVIKQVKQGFANYQPRGRAAKSILKYVLFYP